MNKNINQEALLIQLTVSQMKAILESVLKQSASLSENQPEIIGIEEVCELTGYKKATVYKLIHERKIPFHKPAHGGRKIFFKLSEIKEWQQSNRIETNEEFFQNHKSLNKVRYVKTIQIRQSIFTLKKLMQILALFPTLFNNYKMQIQELKEKIAKYEADNEIIDNLFIDENKN